MVVAGCAVAPWLLLNGSFANAQSAEASAGAIARGGLVDEVVVEGIRDRQAAELLELPSQVDSVGRELIESIGAQSAQEILHRMPAAMQSTTRADSVVFGLDFANGSGVPFPTSLANLRDLGPDRTLVLVNGRRHVAGSADSSAVDTNAIPVSLIERVDLITGSAAALYGGDAAAGALNFVLKENFEGIEAAAQARQYEGGLGREYSGSLLSGINFGADDRANVTLALDFTKRSEINARNSGVGVNSTYQPVGNPNLYAQTADLTPELIAAGVRAGDFIATLDPQVQQLFSAERLAAANDPRTIAYLRGYKWAEYNRTGSFGFDIDGDGLADAIGGDLNHDGVDDCETAWPFTGGRRENCWTLDEHSGQLRAYRNGTFFGGFSTPDGDGDLYPPDDVTILDPKFERVVVALNGGVRLSDSARAFLETKFVTAEAANRADNAFNVIPRYQPLGLDNPFIPQSLLDLYEDFVAANPDVEVSAARVLSSRDLFTYSGRDKQTSRTVQLVGGVEGTLGERMHYEISGQFGSTRQKNTRSVVYTDRLFAALDVVADPVTGKPVCRSNIDPTAVPPGGIDFVTFAAGDGQCQPLNPFSPGGSFPQQSAETLRFLNFPADLSTDLEQVVFRGALSGELDEALSLPAGPIVYTAGAEYRRESSRSSASQNIIDGHAYGMSLTPIAGSIDVKEVFADFAIPLLREVRGAEELLITATGRYSDYSRSGGAFTFGSGLVWAPVQGLRVRGSVSRAIRAPTVGNLFVPTTSTLTPGMTGYDPCVVTQIDQGPAPNNRRRNCAADGIPADFVEESSAGSFESVSGTNPDLTPEVAHTLTAGLVITPAKLPNTSLTLDYYRIELDDDIEFVDYGTAIAACYDAASLDNAFCAQHQRDRDPASLAYLRVTRGADLLVNYGSIVTSGIDIAFQQRFPLASAGTLDFALNATRVLRYDEYRIAGQPSVGNNRLGEYGTPEWTATTSLSWTRGPFDVTWNSLWYGSQLSTDEESVPFITTQFGGPPIHLDAVWVHDLSAGYRIDTGLGVRLGISNFTDEQPPRFLVDTQPVNAFGPMYFVSLNWRPGAAGGR
ncbi:MAG TPA: TonB-dependent receptor [Povalibacter sp.]|uniref:TonB-dependent receptor domain-containing protein n=1 Tax=Povalibacter sp. TaxID=1962978 RepID=UPI002C431187|nr:TonB-dependent receptor [Povalibacter sp.]HMN43570.1 TonB-dependent receptor [Povalibacter sp.]